MLFYRQRLTTKFWYVDPIKVHGLPLGINFIPEVNFHSQIKVSKSQNIVLLTKLLLFGII